jgi:hypothetical protein
MERAQRRNEKGRRRRVHGAEADQPRVSPLVTGCRPQPVDSGQHLLHVGQQLAALPADPGAGPAPVEEGHLELALELGHRLAQSRLGEMESLAGATE